MYIDLPAQSKEPIESEEPATEQDRDLQSPRAGLASWTHLHLLNHKAWRGGFVTRPGSSPAVTRSSLVGDIPGLRGQAVQKTSQVGGRGGCHPALRALHGGGGPASSRLLVSTSGQRRRAVRGFAFSPRQCQLTPAVPRAGEKSSHGEERQDLASAQPESWSPGADGQGALGTSPC